MNWIIVDASGQTVASGFQTAEAAEKTKQNLQESTGQKDLKVVQVLLG